MLEQYQLSFEDALSELEALVDTLERDDLPLDESIMRFGNGLVTARASHGIEAINFTMNTNKLLNQNEQ